MHRQEEILAAMSRIGTMVKGKVTVSRTAKSGRQYYSLQARRGGRNVTRYLAADKVSAVREATENYRRFMELVEEYVEASSRRLNL